MRWRPIQRDPRAVLGAVKAWPDGIEAGGKASAAASLDSPLRAARLHAQGRDEGTAAKHEQRNS